MAKMKILYPHPAILLENGGERYLVVTDLHVGFEERFAAEGIRIGTSTERMEKELVGLIEEHRPSKTIILGDLKHSVGKTGTADLKDMPAFMNRMATRTQLLLIPGNHDGGILWLLPKVVKVVEEGYLVLDRIGLTHGHLKPPEVFGSCQTIVMGHLHPVYRRRGSLLTGTQAWVFLKCEREVLFGDGGGRVRIVVMPSFNRELSGSGDPWATEKEISPIVRRARTGLLEARVASLDGDMIGDEESLPYVL